MRIDLDREADGFLDRLVGLAREAEDEGAVSDDAKLAAILGESFGNVDEHAFLDVVKDLLVAGFVADQQEPQAVVLKYLQGRARHIGLGIARPDDPELSDLARKRFDARYVVRQRVVVEEEFLYLWKCLLRPRELFDYVADAAGTVAVAADRLRPETERATRLAAAAAVERNIGVLQIADEIVFDDEVTLVDRCDEGQCVHVLEDRAVLVVHDGTVGIAPGQPGNAGEIAALGHVLDGEIELVAGDEIDGCRRL